MLDYEQKQDNPRGLAAAILLQSVLDYNDLAPDNHERKQELESFFASEWFDKLCGMCNLVPKRIREKLASGSFRVPINNLRSQKR